MIPNTRSIRACEPRRPQMLVAVKPNARRTERYEHIEFEKGYYFQEAMHVQCNSSPDHVRDMKRLCSRFANYTTTSAGTRLTEPFSNPDFLQGTQKLSEEARAAPRLLFKNAERLAAAMSRAQKLWPHVAVKPRWGCLSKLEDDALCLS